MKILSQSFCARDTLDVARELIGQILRRDDVVLRITETEAYCFPNDSANHSRVGRTARNAPMWGPAGYAYVYLCYGLHSMLNIVTQAEGQPAAVLIRACEPLEGLATVEQRRASARGVALLAGPGRVAAALGLDRSFSGHNLCAPGELELCCGKMAQRILVGPRVGIDYALEPDRVAPWRFADADSAWITHRKSLKPV